jgi:processive 1,2-diacylglycerol beta-glucosyltransferase/1,2-diacylglycerol 3-beta-galactosyltransferase
MENKKQKYMFFYLRTGGGHLAPAKAVANYLEKYYPNETSVVLVDGLKEAPEYSRFILEDGYRILQNNAKWSFEFLYAVNKFPLFAQSNSALVSGRVVPYIQKQILSELPDKIVIFHFFLIKPVYSILKKHKLNIPVITVVTDPYSAHPVWFLNKKQKMVVFSNKVKEFALSQKIKPQNIQVFQFLLDEKFSNPINSNLVPSLKEKYNIDKKLKTVLIVGGGDGIPRGSIILTKLIEAKINANIIIVCGKNEKLFKFATKLKIKQNIENLHVYGYVDFIYDLLNISDVVISKCGASTFMEILLSKKIPVITDYIWEQEKGNVDYLVENNMGIFEKKLKKLPEIINRLITDENYYNSFIKNINAAGIKNGLKDFAEYLLKI